MASNIQWLTFPASDGPFQGRFPFGIKLLVFEPVAGVERVEGGGWRVEGKCGWVPATPPPVFSLQRSTLQPTPFQGASMPGMDIASSLRGPTGSGAGRLPVSSIQYEGGMVNRSVQKIFLKIESTPGIGKTAGILFAILPIRNNPSKRSPPNKMPSICKLPIFVKRFRLPGSTGGWHDEKVSSATGAS